MKRFNVGTGFFDENKTIDAFIEEVIKVFEKYNLMILFDDELLIGKDFWNFVCRSDEGYKTVLEAYRESAPIIKQALDSIKKAYLG